MAPSAIRKYCTTVASRSAVRVGFSRSVRPSYRPFLALASRGATSAAAPITEAFPFLSRRSAAEGGIPGSFGEVAAASSGSAPENVKVIRDMDAFEAEVYRQPAQPLAIFFSVKFNNHNKQLLDQFMAMANSVGSNVSFLIVDVDEVPRAAYHCGVEQPCTFVVQYKGDAFRRRIADSIGTKTPQQLIGDLRAALDACLSALQQPEPPQQRVEWYSHSIPVDNLNVYRVNWPTA
ncbi:uncharacterized protein LOC34621742 [Cyclospora cayetanensis]|uniref:Uncharacterized protein LOC34621742 n=2 Tax=Cyclospora cayetanensis TaxID=88456 RepID=A0A6P5WDJ3_9EIME|nr:uncharacterized protein LOC34621742 [Cyclospora cayetanensis]OEH77883.1 putative RNA-binding protein [Cyclospora cayetanensis]